MCQNPQVKYKGQYVPAHQFVHQMDPLQSELCVELCDYAGEVSTSSWTTWIWGLFHTRTESTTFK